MPPISLLGDVDMAIPVPPFKNKEHHRGAFIVLKTMREQHVLTDVAISAGSKEIRAHRAVLASASPYFYAMFTADLSESKQEVVTLKEVDPDALELLIEYCYTAEVPINEENVQTLLPAAGLLQLNDVINACCEFLKSQLHPTNCLGIRLFADMHSCRDLMQAAHSYIEQHFTEVMSCEEFLQLSAESIIEFIASDRLSVPSEDKVFEAVIAWVNYDVANRDSSLPKLIEYVRLPLLPRDYLIERVETEPLIKRSFACKDFLIEALKYHLVPRFQRSYIQSPRTRSRAPFGFPKVLYVVGGQAPKAIRSVECYDFQFEKWYNSADMHSRRCRAGVAVLNGLIYCVGGFNGSLRVRTVDCYDPRKDEWRPIASMEARRSTLGAAVLNGLLYAVGGFDGTAGLNSCEAYDPRSNEWRQVPAMSVRRSSVGVGVLRGMLYAVGGYDGASRQCLNSVERYDPTRNEWTMVADMTVKRSGAGVGVLGGLLYAVGGHDGPHVRKSVEYYNIENNTWTSVADMSMARRNAGVTTIDGVIYVVGGDDGTNNLATVEIYNPRNDEWMTMPAQMSTGRSYAGLVHIDKVYPTNREGNGNSQNANSGPFNK
eukprot:Seg160.4 transcript_id=Seg160.4/GoldUCD/mRNA.D3Y31 product="Kelch-like protein 3" protein_id=Seg160.4/GoldUCD/D3Y31